MDVGKRLFVLGGSGFIGRHTIAEAVRQGWEVTALVRSAAAAASVSKSGARSLMGDAKDPSSWASDLANTNVVIDLLQPERPKRLGRRQMRAISTERQAMTARLAGALSALAPAARPRLISVSGIDDLAPDARGELSRHSDQRSKEYGFNSVGIPVRQIIERSGVAASYVYLGTVYGPGGSFADNIVPAIAAGKWKNFGSSADAMILVHVDDVARALVRVAAIGADAAPGTSFVVTDTETVPMPTFTKLVAQTLGVAAPGGAPRWIAAIVAGAPIIETMIRPERARPSLTELDNFELTYPSYREGVPATMDKLKQN